MLLGLLLNRQPCKSHRKGARGVTAYTVEPPWAHCLDYSVSDCSVLTQYIGSPVSPRHPFERTSSDVILVVVFPPSSVLLFLASRASSPSVPFILQSLDAIEDRDRHQLSHPRRLCPTLSYSCPSTALLD